jgi:hypothetical protein
MVERRPFFLRDEAPLLMVRPGDAVEALFSLGRSDGSKEGTLL